MLLLNHEIEDGDFKEGQSILIPQVASKMLIFNPLEGFDDNKNFLSRAMPGLQPSSSPSEIMRDSFCNQLSQARLNHRALLHASAFNREGCQRLTGWS